MRSVEEVRDLLSRTGMVVSREHPHLARRLQRMASTGELVALLPGVYVPRHQSPDLDLRSRVAARWCPEGVLTGPAAARSSFWSEVRFAVVTMSASRKRVSAQGFSLVREQIPPELVVERSGLRLTAPALTALDLVATHGGAGIDQVVRTRASSLAQLHEALRLTPGRWGNQARRAMLHDSRDEPWSEAERLAHALLRQAKIGGWTANFPVTVAGRRYYLDVAFPGRRVVIEIDGYETHARLEQFHRDRRRWSDLTAAGWRIVHLTWRQLVDEPAWVIDSIRAALAWRT